MKAYLTNALLLPVALLLGLLLAGQSYAQSVTGREDWDYSVEAYLWGPDIDIETADGSNQEVKFSDLVDVTRGGFMGGFYAQQEKWRFGVDAIYLDADERIKAPVEEGVELNRLDLEVWYVSPTVAYQVARYDRSQFYVFGGVRYLWAEPTATLRTDDPLPPGKSDVSESDGVWDGIVGIHGITRLGERWYLDYLADIGAGDSDAVYQLLVGLNHRFKRFDATAGYRYIRWDLDSSLFNEIKFNGFYAGAKIYF